MSGGVESGAETNVRVGLIGAGRWATLHRDALATLGVPLDRVLVATESSAERVRGDWGVPAFVSLERFLDGGPEAVIIASPNHLHVEHASAALRAGRHVLLEKPMALDVVGAERLLREADEAGRVLALGHEMRAFAWAQRAKRLLDDGVLGTPRHLALDLWRRPYRAGSGGWKADPAKLGSSILEEPIHYLDLARWLLGEPRALQAFATSRAGHEDGWENLDVRLWTDHGQASVTRSVAAWGHRVTLTLIGDEGAFRAHWVGSMDADPDPLVEAWLHAGNDRDAPAERLDLREATGHAHDLPLQTKAFLAACAGGPPPLADGRDGLAAVRLCLEAERSLREGESKIELGSSRVQTT
ncbi:MAG: Gfo/Idh/MocA family oxidoreductase [Trueperaceae bacterium]|nr:Gfo/Idh/MocA family oxidoreductase [Trueperaceae bacterium]